MSVVEDVSSLPQFVDPRGTHPHPERPVLGPRVDQWAAFLSAGEAAGYPPGRVRRALELLKAEDQGYEMVNGNTAATEAALADASAGLSASHPGWGWKRHRTHRWDGVMGALGSWVVSVEPAGAEWEWRREDDPRHGQPSILRGYSSTWELAAKAAMGEIPPEHPEARIIFDSRRAEVVRMLSHTFECAKRGGECICPGVAP